MQASSDIKLSFTAGDDTTTNLPHRWQDAIAVPAAKIAPLQGALSAVFPVERGYVKIRQRFLNFDGKYVLHCHILGHEDRGMMQLLEVIST